MDVMMNLCHHYVTKCIHYKRKDYLVDVMSAEDMQANLSERLTTDFKAEVMISLNNLDLMLIVHFILET